jgi:cytochrome c oxidase accessory protein FixG
MRPEDLIDVEQIAPAEFGELDLYKKREKIYTRQIEGFFQKIRVFTGLPLLLGYFLVPWLNWGERQMVLFDLPARQFHILGLTLWPQDFPLLAWLLIIAAWALFAVTAAAGRVWCGYTCPQTVWTAIFMWLEQKTEGSRNQRIKLDKMPWSLSKATRKLAKHSGWMFVAFLTGMTFVGYFYPIRELLPELLLFDTGKWQALWTLFFTLATYINAGWMREQVCLYMCPYARFQSVMFDPDTLIVSYDYRRGEPRGSRKRNTVDSPAHGLGDCIDCQLCVQVCPTGIDIRDGLQYECIGCAMCVDACNSIMDKMAYPRGLIRYTSERELEGEHTHWIRFRSVGYFAGVIVMALVFSWYMMVRIPLELDIIRDRNQLYVMRDDGRIENIYTLRLLNMDNKPHQFMLSIDGLAGATVLGQTTHSLNASEVRTVNLRIALDPSTMKSPSKEFQFYATAVDQPALTAGSESTFLKPIRR